MSALKVLMDKNGKDFIERCICLVGIGRDAEVELATSAAAELAAKDAALGAARRFVLELSVFEIELAREVWSNTNTHIVLDRRADLVVALAKLEALK